MTPQKNNIVTKQIFSAFCIVELLILIVLKVFSIVFVRSYKETLLMFSAILINALFMLFLTLRVKKAGLDTKITGIPLAVFVTLLADCFLVLLKDFADLEIIDFISADTSTMIGFVIFGLVQVIYAIHLGITKRRLAVRIAFYLVFVAVVYALGMMTFDRLLACLSMSQLILNTVYAWIEHHKNKTPASLWLALGITLFFGCDSLIMMRMLLTPSGFIYEAVCFMVWVFYIPSQVVLTTSYLVERTKN